MGDGTCTHCGRAPVMVDVLVPAETSHTGEPRWKKAPIDACIANQVRIMQNEARRTGRPQTAGACCGHGKAPGEIRLAPVGERLP